MTSEQFNKLENVVKKATYLVDNIEAKEVYFKPQSRFNVHRVRGIWVAVEKDNNGRFREMIAFDRCVDALNYITFRSLKIFS